LCGFPATLQGCCKQSIVLVAKIVLVGINNFSSDNMIVEKKLTYNNNYNLLLLYVYFCQQFECRCEKVTAKNHISCSVICED
jgi:hypothetical protein